MASAVVMATTPPFKLDGGTAFSLAVAFSLMPSAQILAAYALPKSTSRKLYYVFLWHAYDFLTHFIIESSYLYHCLCSYQQLPARTPDISHPAAWGGEPQAFLYNRPDRRYGPFYSEGPMARLWQEYAKADRRWGGADLNIMSLEILTIGLGGPAAVYICYLVSKITISNDETVKNRYLPRLWFTASALATGELYGGFMTFAPEWLSGNTGLAGEDPVYLWLYLVFFNILWVFVPLWILYVAFGEISAAFRTGSRTNSSKKLT
ncbi:hypothetical protein H2200_006584 [Cladophialophora chaetospira]|uniref:EXPERA domain-containing protein n=1 Tax=Cladophialophora chaetospira TaxID=386627 RepID=A0AA38X8H2_9EURO|nr:hypothetical protein H2200_006584 [Cladophialophora chaetospira]